MKFKIGQQVECLIYGKGTIIELDNRKHYPISVYFDNGAWHEYTKNGQFRIDGKISLTPGTWKVEEILPEPKFEKGQPVWVRDEDGQEWRLRYYSHKENKKHFVFCEQRKSGRSINYNFIKPVEGTDPND